MKKLLSLLLAGTVFYGCQQEITTEEPQENSSTTRVASSSSEDYYWLGDQKIPLQKMDNKFYVMYDSANEGRLRGEFAKTGMAFTEIQDNDLQQYANIKNFDAKKLSCFKIATIEGDYKSVAPILTQAYYSAPYYKTNIGEGRLTNRFCIALKDTAGLLQLEKLAKENSVEILGVSELDGWYELACTNLSTGNALEMGNLFYETGLFKSVGYDLGARGRLANINEPLYQNGTLWHLGNNTTNSSVHINYIAARAIVPQVSSSVKVAVVDSGVQYGHSDLYNVLPGWEAETQSSPNIYSDHPHGTQVAGFIAARPNNGQAVAGVAYGATILPISFNVYYNHNNQNDPYNGSILSSADVMVRAVNRAVSEGAKIINCSWQYPDNRVVNAVKSALDSGCVVVFASGNSNGAVSSPANSDPRIIVVGAVNRNGARAYFSNYGSQLDVVAPGEDVTSTTVGSGYAYRTDSGTSFAAPQVSAIAALILSKYPNFTQQQVADIIQSTANRYPSRHNEYGYGLVDAHKALFGHLAISRYQNLPGDATCTGTMYTYRVPEPPTGVSFSNWSISPSSYTVTGGTNSRELKITFTDADNYTLSASFTLPNGAAYTVTEQVPVVYAPPVLRATGPAMGPNESWLGYIVEGNVHWVRPGTRAVVYMDGNNYVGASFEWIFSGLSFHSLAAPYVYYTDLSSWSGSGYSYYQIRCRAYKNGQYSAWGSVWLYISNDPPQNRRQMSNTNDDETTKDTDPESEDSGEIDG